MARGGSGPGGHNNIITATTATPKDISKLTQYALGIYESTPPDLHNKEEVQAAIISYFNNCIESGIRPGNLGLYAALGMSRQDYHDTITGKNKSKVSPDCIDTMKKAVQAIGAFREGLALEGKINPVTYIFMGKNFDHLTDSQQIELTANPTNARQTPEEIAKQIEDIPIDTTYKDIE
jgi:hypothetical protein